MIKQNLKQEKRWLLFLFAAFIALLELPIMSDADITKTMSFQIKQHIPLPISEVAIDWLKVGERKDEEVIKQQILLIPCENEIIKDTKIF